MGRRKKNRGYKKQKAQAQLKPETPVVAAEPRTVKTVEPCTLRPVWYWIFAVYAVPAVVAGTIVHGLWMLATWAAVTLGLRFGGMGQLITMTVLLSGLAWLFGTIRFAIGAFGCLRDRDWGLKLVRGASTVIVLSASIYFLAGAVGKAMEANGNNIQFIVIAFLQVLGTACVPVAALVLTERAQRRGWFDRIQEPGWTGAAYLGPILLSAVVALIAFETWG